MTDLEHGIQVQESAFHFLFCYTRHGTPVAGRLWKWNCIHRVGSPGAKFSRTRKSNLSANQQVIELIQTIYLNIGEYGSIVQLNEGECTTTLLTP